MGSERTAVTERLSWVAGESDFSSATGERDSVVGIRIQNICSDWQEVMLDPELRLKPGGEEWLQYKRVWRELLASALVKALTFTHFLERERQKKQKRK